MLSHVWPKSISHWNELAIRTFSFENKLGFANAWVLEWMRDVNFRVEVLGRVYSPVGRYSINNQDR